MFARVDVGLRQGTSSHLPPQVLKSQPKAFSIQSALFFTHASTRQTAYQMHLLEPVIEQKT